MELGQILLDIKMETDPKIILSVLKAAQTRLGELDKTILPKEESYKVPRWIKEDKELELTYIILRSELEKQGVQINTDIQKKEAELILGKPMLLARRFIRESAITADLNQVLRELIKLSVVLSLNSFMRKGEPISNNMNAYVRRFTWLHTYLERNFPGYIENGMILVPLLGVQPQEYMEK